MRFTSLNLAALATLGCLCAPQLVHAQYRNSSFALDTGYFLISQPSITDSRGSILPDVDSRGDRLARGIRVGGEGNFKLHHDHWWFDARLNLNFPNFGSVSADAAAYEQASDYQGATELGTIMGLEGLAGVRYYFWTDHVRPYLQVGLSYQHLWTFGSGAGATCSASSSLCGDSSVTNAAAFLPHVNMMGVHVTPAVEFIASKDFAIHAMVDLQHAINFQAAANNIITFGLGVMFYS